jgi:predicted N-acetyltransferase YhbS
MLNEFDAKARDWDNNPLQITIREEKPEDYSPVSELIATAFRSMPHADGDEHLLVEALRKNIAFIPALSLVAETSDRLVGHILFTPLQIIRDDKVHYSLALAPVSVLPEYQKQGIGSRLISEGHRIAKSLGYTSCFVLGHPDYYPRFGYLPSSNWKIDPPAGTPPEAFMAIEFIPDALSGVTGSLKYLPEFGI